MESMDEIHNKYIELEKEQIIKKGDSTSLAEIETQVFKIYEWENQYYNDQAYRDQLPESIRMSIEQEFTNASNLFTQAVNLRNNDIIAFTQNRAGFQEAVRGYYKALYDNFVRDYRGWKLDKGSSEKIEQLDEIISAAKARQEHIEQDAQRIREDAQTINSRQKATAEATQDVSLSSLAQYFYQLVQGSRSTGEKLSGRRRLYERIIKPFGGYQGASRLWLILAVVVFGLTYWVADSQLHPFLAALSNPKESSLISSGASTIYALLVAKALLLAVPVYAIRFCLKNYGSNKHLAADALHKAKTLQTLHAYLSISPDDEAARREIAVTVAQLVFTPTESGFIMQKGDYEGPHINIGTPPKH